MENAKGEQFIRNGFEGPGIDRLARDSVLNKSVPFFPYCLLDLSGQHFFVFDIVAKNTRRQVARRLTVGFGQVGERVGQVFQQV